ncbi:hypothetical protein ACGFZH_11795 [Streptomyces zaomyceticus]|uniref:hypothetical protein n=1 Tax=Streptomyces TaxID=1883 RepID=UPI0037234D2A
MGDDDEVLVNEPGRFIHIGQGAELTDVDVAVEQESGESAGGDGPGEGVCQGAAPGEDQQRRECGDGGFDTEEGALAEGRGDCVVAVGEARVEVGVGCKADCGQETGDCAQSPVCSGRASQIMGHGVAPA